MKLLYITNGVCGIGGLERVLSVKTSYFADVMNYKVHILTLNEQFDTPFYSFSHRIVFHNIKTQAGRIGYIQSYIKGINQKVKQINPDIISVCDDGVKGLFVPLWIKKGNAVIIYERHASMQLNGAVWQKKMMRIGSYLYDKVIVLTQYNLSEWKSKNLEVIPNPLSFFPRTCSNLENKRVICVGSISYNKGYDLLINAWRRIVSVYPDWSVYIYGKGNTDEFQKIISNQGLSEQIQFCGPSNDIQTKYLDSSIFVLPSRSEGFGMVLIEAMACGLPCISFDCPCGPRDIIKDGEDGFLVEKENIDQLADAILKLIANKDLRMVMGKQARINVQRYEIGSIAEQWNILFDKLIQKK